MDDTMSQVEKQVAMDSLQSFLVDHWVDPTLATVARGREETVGELLAVLNASDNPRDALALLALEAIVAFCENGPEKDIRKYSLTRIRDRLDHFRHVMGIVTNK